MIEEKKKFQEVLNVGLEVIQTRDIDILLERILTKARYLTNADAGSIYIKEGDKLLFRYTQNDTLQNLLLPGKKLIYSTFTVPVNNQSISGYVANTGQVLNIENVYELTDSFPFSFDPSYDRLSGYRTQSVLCFPLKTNTDEVVGVLQLINATNGLGKIVPFQPQDEPFVVHFANNAAIAIERATMTRDIILRMIKMAELRDPSETGAHVNRVSSCSVELYEAWAHSKGIDRAEIEQNRDILKMAAMLHDVGKVAITDLILQKPDRLNNNEFEIMKRHTYMGARLFSHQRSDFDRAAFLVTLNHHEHWDGNGYPGFIDHTTGRPLPGYRGSDGRARGKKHDEIPVFGRIVAICDVFDALSSGRSYKEPWKEDRVLETMVSERGKHFDPEMLDVFLSNLEIVRNIMHLYPETTG
ncbi:MAG: GAF domain-containing protein [Syntrophorhabdaceae bacterium]|nr:GAF domain-containing protein [Syntrophorhabdaceae bacterium]MDD4195516.1 GAF domain-containing protein [Syntrophorhabdaceae bacterium]